MHLHAQRIRHVWLEGGPTVAAAFVRAGLVDEVIVYVAPRCSAPAALPSRTRASRPSPTALRLRPDDVTLLGDDVRISEVQEGLMFTGIVEELGEVVAVEAQATRHGSRCAGRS